MARHLTVAALSLLVNTAVRVSEMSLTASC
jgi:hypothetical protein